MPKPGISYKDAGVDIDAKMSAIDRFKESARATLGTNAGPIGHFGGTYLVPSGPDRILVASADGVGTKLKLAFALGGDAHPAVGRDIVNHCVNDILALGATPLFFLDYFATGKLDPDVAAKVVSGIADACLENGMALLGGETAEMPDMYPDGEYDLAGFIVGSVEPRRVVDGSQIEPGDIVIGFPSTGLHTNGYSLARRIIGLTGDHQSDREVLEGTRLDDGSGLGDALMAPHRSYQSGIRPLVDAGLVRGMAHITGGGLKDNLPRTLPPGCIARLDPDSWPSLPIFDHLIQRGSVAFEEQFRVFNMGIGFVVIARAEHRDAILAAAPEGRHIGDIVGRNTTHEAAVQGLSC